MAGDETRTHQQSNDRCFKFVDEGATTTPYKQYLRYTHDGWLLETFNFYTNGSFEILSAEQTKMGSLSIERDDHFDEVGKCKNGFTVEISPRFFERLRECFQQQA